MVSIKFWRGKFSRPATGYECIAHALAFDRGVGRDQHRYVFLTPFSKKAVSRNFDYLSGLILTRS